MLTQETKRKIDSARDILVGKVPDPKAQVEQITTALIYKFMDDMDKEAQELGGKARFFTNGYEKYSWTKLLDSRLGGQERLNLYVEAITNLAQNKYLPSLFREVFRNLTLPFRDPATLSLFLKEINNFEYDHSENLGDSYEYLLSILGSQGEAGQFRTPRHLIDFIVETVDPQKDETILDPACGTAGFLIAAYKYIIKNHQDKPLNPDERKELVSHFIGYDISPDMVKIALVNLYLHGFQDPKIIEYDTLTNDNKWEDMFDVVLTNPPFMTPKGGIRPHKRFSIQANRSEILFLDYAIEHLSTRGKGGIIVPEGILHNNFSSYKQVRKNLIEKDLLYAIVELPHGVFKPYASVKTHILFLDHQVAKGKNDVLFIRVNDDGFTQTDARKPSDKNDLPKALELLNSYKKGALDLKNDFDFNLVEKPVILTDKKISLIGRRYKAIKIAEKSKYPIVRLDNSLITIKKGKSPTENTEEGEFTFVVSAKERKTADHYDFECKAVCIPIVSSTGHGHASVRRIHYVEGKFALANIMCAITVKDEKRINSKYLFYILSSKKDEILAPLMTGTSNVSLEQDDLYDLEIPLPGIKEQNEFVNKQEELEIKVKKLQKEIEEMELIVDSKTLNFWGE